jgi:hypothetical protein
MRLSDGFGARNSSPGNIFFHRVPSRTEPGKPFLRRKLATRHRNPPSVIEQPRSEIEQFAGIRRYALPSNLFVFNHLEISTIGPPRARNITTR